MAPSATVIVPDSDRPYRLGAGLFFLVLTLVYYVPSLGWLPRGIHEWAQADRLAIAISFYDNGLHFFRPQTLNISSIDGVVGVEFPLVAYLAALLAKLVGRGAVAPLYRSLTIAAAWLAYYYLFRLVFDRTRQVVAALVPGVFLAASPVFAYYAGSFMPDPVGACLVVVAAYYLLRYPTSRRFGDLGLAIGLLTLATLTKLSAGIYLLAALGIQLLWAYLYPAALTLRQRWLLLLAAALSLGSIAGYTLYTYYLNESYHSSLFLASPKPIESMEQYRYVLMRVRRDWLREYFVPLQYYVLLASVLVCLLSLPRILRTDWRWAALLGVASIGALLFGREMGTQFSDHDYYVLASFWPGLVLLVALATTQVAQRLERVPRLLRHGLFGALLVALLVPGLRHYRARMGDPYLAFSDYYHYRWMQGGASQLAADQVPTTATILVLGEEIPNLSLVYFDRRGVTWNPSLQDLTMTDVLQRMTDVGLDYLIMRQAVYQELQRLHLASSGEFKLVRSTPQYVVLKRLHAPRHW